MKIKNLILISVFAALWSSIELFVGSFLHSISFSGIPIVGAIVSPKGFILLFLATCIMTVLAFKSEEKGSILILAFITALIRLFGLGGVNYNPSLAILLEGIIFELLLNFFGFRKTRFLVICAAIIMGILGTGLINIFGYYLMRFFKGKSIYFILTIFMASSIKGGLGAFLGSITGLKIVRKLNAKNKGL